MNTSSPLRKRMLILGVSLFELGRCHPELQLKDGLRHLNLWLGFSHFRYRLRGGFMQLVSSQSLMCIFLFKCSTPSFVSNSKTSLFLQFQDVSKNELVEMPSHILAENIHNKWMLQSRDRGSDLFIAMVDDFVRSFMQSIAYNAGPLR